MKNIKILIAFVALFSILSLAQEKMTKEQWQSEMNNLKAKKSALTTQVNTLKTDVDNLKAMNLQDPEDCIDELYKMVGANRSDVDNFRKAVNELNGKISRKEGPKADRQTDLNVLKANKISALPEFFNKVHVDMQRSLDNWIEEVKEINYTVVRGDHLWGIARKKEHYGNPFAWPVIYKANRDKIKNPDLIYPKQVFKIPNLTEEEKAKYERLRKNFKPAPVQ
ncbi:MAG: LysM peptidoglycan-binding domain-containing protein [Ignavibacterium sp.]|nr:LysM peptidoglycan-binding domain-containing protein [Ignavibacterium sp.]MCX7610932.1 LysM peptidoglycan-binding domain-containing protein [Ignavibacterium sp.]MDW8375578.1 LysM peptidoglycan-binding domain-containing protein [Ignavibacteriales bacterium]